MVALTSETLKKDSEKFKGSFQPNLLSKTEGRQCRDSSSEST